MLKKDVIAKLTELNIEHDPKATAKELEALLPEGVAAEIEKGEPTEESVHSKNGSLIRTYSKAVHGDNFEELANEFVSHTPDTEVRVK